MCLDASGELGTIASIELTLLEGQHLRPRQKVTRRAVVIRRERSSSRDAVGVPLAVPEVVDGKALFNGRTLADWVGDAVDRLVRAIEPRAVVLFGSVARGDDGPYSDIDLLAIIDDGRRQHELATAALRAVAGLPPEVDVVVVTQHSVDSRRDVPGTLIRPALREGRVVYRRGHRA